MDSVARKVTQSPPSIEIDGVLYRQCGEGRKQRRAGAVECGEIKPLTAEFWPINSGYTDGFGIVCLACKARQDTRYEERVATALVPIKIDDAVPIGGNGRCRGVWLDVDDVETPYLVIVEACRYWGLDSQGQIQRIEGEPALSAGLMVCKLPTISGTKPAYVLRHDLVPLWFAGIETAKMRNRERAIQLAAFQKICGQVLADYFFGTKTAQPSPTERVEPDGTIVQQDGMQVVEYLDSALSKHLGPIRAALAHLGLLPGIAKDAHDAATASKEAYRAAWNAARSLQGADKILTRQIIRGQIYIFRLVSTHWRAILCRDFFEYLDDKEIIGIGQTGPDGSVETLRLRYYGGKFHFLPEDYDVLSVFQTDYPDKVEDTLLIKPLSGCARLTVVKTSRKSLTFLSATQGGIDEYRDFEGFWSLRMLRDFMGIEDAVQEVLI